MSTVNSTSAGEVLAQYRLQSEDKPASNELGKSAFLELMIAQLNNQSPLEPQDNSEWVAQLAQFSSVESLENLSSSVDNIAGNYRSSQALQASAMVGRDVLVDTEEAYLPPEGKILGLAQLPSGTSEVAISVYNSAGELIRKQAMGQQGAGDLPIVWDGKNERGDVMPAGDYRVKAEARYAGEMTQLNTYLNASVDSVSIDGGGNVTLNLGGKGAVGLSDVKQIF